MNVSWGKSYAHVIESLSKQLEGNPFSCVFCASIDNLSMIISSSLQPHAEQVLLDLSRYLKESIKEITASYHVDRDRLYILTRHPAAVAVEDIIREIQAAIVAYGATTEQPIPLSSTIGGVCIPDIAKTAEDAVDKAYVALNDAKELSRPYMVYKDEKRHRIESKNQVILANYIQDALQQNKLRLAYQPITHAKSGEVHYYECLLRIIGPQHATTSAGPFIPIAERLGFIDLIDAFVLKMAVDDLQNSPNLRLAVNVSNNSVHSHHWQHMALDLLSDTKIASRIMIEMTETSEQHDLKSTASFIENLKKRGCKVALDDFGSGYTSFTQLQSLPVDTIKIDGAFVRNIVDNKEDRFFVQTLKAFSDNFGMSTVAEFVENKEIADILIDMEIDYLQGNYLSPAVDYRPWL